MLFDAFLWSLFGEPTFVLVSLTVFCFLCEDEDA